jgi:hypothetical protein
MKVQKSKEKSLSKTAVSTAEMGEQTVGRRRALKTLGLGSAGAMLAGCGGDPSSAEQVKMVPEPTADDGLVELLFVQEAAGAELNGDSLVLVDVKPRTLFFADRPEDIAGYLGYREYVDMVYNGPDNFVENPPNATLMVLKGEEMIPVVMELSAKPRVDGNNLVYDTVKVIQGDAPTGGKTAVLFIDTIGRPMSPGSVAGVHRRQRRRAIR